MPIKTRRLLVPTWIGALAVSSLLPYSIKTKLQITAACRFNHTLAHLAAFAAFSASSLWFGRTKAEKLAALIVPLAASATLEILEATVFVEPLEPRDIALNLIGSVIGLIAILTLRRAKIPSSR